MSNEKSAVLMKAKHEGKMKTLSMCAWSRLLGVTEYFVRNKKTREGMTDQQIVDSAIAESGSGATIEAMRKNFLFRGARV